VPAKKIAKINKIATTSPPLGLLWGGGDFNTNAAYVAVSKTAYTAVASAAYSNSMAAGYQEFLYATPARMCADAFSVA
jgi:hypothetical protein